MTFQNDIDLNIKINAAPPLNQINLNNNNQSKINILSRQSSHDNNINYNIKSNIKNSTHSIK